MAEEGEQDEGKETEKERKERGDGELEKDGENGEEDGWERKRDGGEVEVEVEGNGGDRKLGRVMDLPRVKYWDDKRVTIYISGQF